MIIIVEFNLLFTSLKSPVISSEFFLSRFPVGSSARIMAGLVIRLLAIATLCCSPPDNCFGYLSSFPSIHSIDKISFKYSSSTFLLSNKRGSRIFFLTLILGMRLKNW